MIKKVDYFQETIPLTKPFNIAIGVKTHVEVFYVTITDHRGQFGIGSCVSAPYVTGETPADTRLSLELLAELLQGRALHWPHLSSIIQSNARKTPAAAAALEIALFDLLGKMNDIAVVDMFGRRQNAMATSVTLDLRPLDEVLDLLNNFCAQGFRTFKIKLGDSTESGLERDIEKVHRCREVAGPDIKIRVDPNQAYSVAQLMNFLDSTRKANLEFIEQPTPVAHYDLLKRQLEGSSEKLAADECLLGLNDSIRLAAQGEPYSIYNIKLMKCGGISQSYIIAQVAQAAQKQVMWGCNIESCSSVAAALQMAMTSVTTHYLDLDGHLFLNYDLCTSDFSLRNGQLQLAQKSSGFGVKPLW